MKRWLAMLLSLCMLAALAGCGKQEEAPYQPDENDYSAALTPEEREAMAQTEVHFSNKQVDQDIHSQLNRKTLTALELYDVVALNISGDFFTSEDIGDELSRYCPNLEKLTISGKLGNLDFLSGLKNLRFL